MKTSEAFCFHDGSLTVKTTGYGEADGSGYIAFNDEALDYEPHEEDSGTTRFQNVAKDDLVAMRDFLNRVFPAPAGDPAIRAALQLFVKQWNACGPNSDFGRYFKNVRDAAVSALDKATGA